MSQFVIQADEAFSAATLWAVAHTLETVLEVAATQSLLSDSESAKIRARADKAAELATEWQRTGRGRLSA